MTHEELIHVLEIGGDAAYRSFSETFKVFADYITQKNAEIKARDDEIRRLRTMIADHECSGVPFGETYRKTRDKPTNLEWLYRHPEKLAETLFCPFEDCKYDEVPLDEDICRKCLLDWLKEEHTDD